MANNKVLSIFKNARFKHYARNKAPDLIWQDPLFFFAFGFGSGAFPYAPGTMGTLFAIPFYLLLAPLPLIYYLTFTIVFIVVSILASQKVSQKIGVHDHPGMCIDEFAGFFVTMINVPATFTWILIGFILFRLFDILKPWPINYVDLHVGGGFGMILDDVLAGIFSCILIHILIILT